MWIIPSNLPQSYLCAQDFLDLKEGLPEQSEKSELSLMWKSKPLLWRTLLAAWKRVWWMQHLCGRMLKHSRHSHFETKYTASLVDIRANPSASPATEKEPMIQDTFGRIYQESLKQLTLFGAYSKTSEDTSVWDMTRFTESFGNWVTLLRQESLQRQKLAHHMREKDFLSWPSPASSSAIQGENEYDGRRGQTLIGAARGQQWMSPKVSTGDYSYQGGDPNKITLNLSGQVKTNWPTPTTMDQMDPKTDKALMKEVTETRPGRTMFSNLRDAILHPSMKDWKPTTPIKDWPTPSANPDNRLPQPDWTWNGLYFTKPDGTKIQTDLNHSVKMVNWQTPRVSDVKDHNGMAIEKIEERMERTDGGASGLMEQLQRLQVMNNNTYPTPYALMEKKYKLKPGTQSSDRNLSAMAIRGELTDGPAGQESDNTTGKNREQLNPKWVALLMGTTLEKTFFVPMVTALWSKQQK